MKATLEIDTTVDTFVEIDAATAFLLALKASLPASLDIEDQGEIAELLPDELSEEEIDQILEQMHEFALNSELDRVFKTSELYRLATNERWVDLSPNTRKSLGRKFRKLVKEHEDEAFDDEQIIKFSTRNLQNMAMYVVTTKQ